MKEDRLIVALDVVDCEVAVKIADVLSPYVTTFKVGWQLFLSGGEKIVARISEKGQVFLDLKLYDIPAQIKRAVEIATRWHVRFLTISLLGGQVMIEEAVRAAEESSFTPGTTLLGVTFLTSLNEDDLETMGFNFSIKQGVLKLAAMGFQAGLKGVVASAQEVRLIKEKVAADLIVVTPGVRLKVDFFDDQKRTATVEEALKAGADFLVVGRPIIKARDPVEKLNLYLEELLKWKV